MAALTRRGGGARAEGGDHRGGDCGRGGGCAIRATRIAGCSPTFVDPVRPPCAGAAARAALAARARRVPGRALPSAPDPVLDRALPPPACSCLWFIACRLFGWEWRWRRKPTRRKGRAADWRPAEAPARALLRDADALAAAGPLRRSRAPAAVPQHPGHRVAPAAPGPPCADQPRHRRRRRRSRTARARGLRPIVAMVERSLFAGRALVESDWRACRAAYEDFAFAEAWR